MSFPIRRLAALSLSLALLTACSAGYSRGGDAAIKPAPTKIGMMQTLFRGAESGMMLAQTQPFSDLLFSQTGVRGEFQIVPDAVEMGRRIQANELQLGVIHGVEFAWLKQKYPELQPLVIAYNQTVHLKAYILVRADNDIRSIADLKGKKLAMPKRNLNHCHLFLHKTIVDAGLNPAGFFACCPTPANMDVALDAVVDGTADVVVIDGVGYESYLSRKPARAAKLQSIKESPIFPTAAIIHRPTVTDPATVKKFHDGMTTAHERAMGRQMLTLWRLSNFGGIPTEYEAMLSSILKDYPTPFLPAVFVADKR